MSGEFKLWIFEYHNGEEGIHIFGEVETMEHLGVRSGTREDLVFLCRND